MSFCVYVYHDPKINIPVYVGMGGIDRPGQHLKSSHNRHLHSLIQKRLLEGFSISPTIVLADTAEDAREMEMLLISMIGRADAGAGTLFNHTDGGEGTWGSPRQQSAHSRAIISRKQKARFAKPGARKAMSIARSRFIEVNGHAGGRKQQPCTVDRTTIFPSRQALINALGQGKAGLKNPNFEWVSQ